MGWVRSVMSRLGPRSLWVAGGPRFFDWTATTSACFRREFQ